MAKLTDRIELTTPADGDFYVTTDISDTTDAATGTDKKITWANIKAGLKTYFDTLYAAALGADDNYVTDAEKTKLANLSGTNTGDQTLASYSITATASELNALDGITATVTELNYTDGVTSNIQTQLDSKASTASPTFTGLLTYVQSVSTSVSLGNLGATETINWNSGINQYGTLDANVAITHSNEADGKSVNLFLSYDGSAQRTITWTDVDVWLNGIDGTAPATPSASGHVLVVRLHRIGTTVYASATGNYAIY